MYFESRYHGSLFAILAISAFAMLSCGEPADETNNLHPDDRWEPNNPAAWFTADLDDSIHTSGDSVDRWDDMTGNFDAVNESGQSAPEKSSVDGRPSIYLDEDALQLSDAGDIFRNREQFAIFAIYQPDVDQNLPSIIFYNSLPGGNGFRRATMEYHTEEEGVFLGARRNDSDEIFRFKSEDTAALGEPLAQINEFDHTNDEGRIFLNGGDPTVESPFLGTGPTSDTSSTGTYIGAPDAPDPRRIEELHLHELIVYQELPSQDEIDAFFEHANSHWNVDVE